MAEWWQSRVLALLLAASATVPREIDSGVVS
jgi:hypothetical protein